MVVYADGPAIGIDGARRRQAVGLARGGGAIGCSGPPRKRHLHALGHRCEMALAVERRKNGAAHESCAAKTGQNGAAEPLHGDAAAIHQAASVPPSTESGGSLPRSI